MLPGPWTPIADFLGVDVGGMRTSAIGAAALSDDREAYPVLILSPSGFSPLLLSAIAEELASHGYVIVGVNHTYETTVTAFSDGRVVPMNPAALGGALGPPTGSHEEVFRRRGAVCEYKAADLRSVADHLGRLAPNAAGLSTDRLDLDRLGAFGHSFGGNAALEWCRTDDRCLAAANLDGALWTTVGSTGLPRPALQVLADHPELALSGAEALQRGITTDPEWYDAERTVVYEGWCNVHRLARPGYTARLTGASHASFMDAPFLPVQSAGAVTGLLDAATIDPRRAWQATSELLLGFFAPHVRGVGTFPDPGFEGRFPDVVVGPP